MIVSLCRDCGFELIGGGDLEGGVCIGSSVGVWFLVWLLQVVG